MQHIVKYRESTRGEGGSISYKGFETFESAMDEVNSIMEKVNLFGPIPDYYLTASYEGIMEHVPETQKYIVP